MSKQENDERLGMRFGRFLALMVTVFAVCFAVIVATRLSDESLSMVLGVVLGFAAVGIPMALLGLIAWFGVRIYEARASHKPAAAAPPPVIVVQSPTPMVQGGYPQMGYDSTSWYPRAPRQFEVIGEEATKSDPPR